MQKENLYIQICRISRARLLANGFFALEEYFGGPVSLLLGFYIVCSYSIYGLTSVFLWELVFSTWYSHSSNLV